MGGRRFRNDFSHHSQRREISVICGTSALVARVCVFLLACDPLTLGGIHIFGLNLWMYLSVPMAAHRDT